MLPPYFFTSCCRHLCFVLVTWRRCQLCWHHAADIFDYCITLPPSLFQVCCIIPAPSLFLLPLLSWPRHFFPALFPFSVRPHPSLFSFILPVLRHLRLCLSVRYYLCLRFLWQLGSTIYMRPPQSLFISIMPGCRIICWPLWRQVVAILVYTY